MVESGVTKASVGSYTSSSVLEVLLNSDPGASPPHSPPRALMASAGVLQRTARLVEYWRDGELLYESDAVPSPHHALLVDIACHSAVTISDVSWRGENLWRWAEYCGQSTGDCSNAIDTKYSTFVSINQVSDSWLSFDLGSWKAVTGLKTWKPGSAGTAGVQDFHVQVTARDILNAADENM